MYILILTLLAWLIFGHHTRRPKARKVTASAATPVSVFPSPADLERHEKERAKAEREAEKTRIKAEKDRAEREQAESDIPYYEEQLARFYEMIGESRAKMKFYRERVKIDEEMNRYSAVIPEKVVQKHITERDRAIRATIKLESQIHAAEKNLNKAKQILKIDTDSETE